jgi:cell division protein FtsL
MNAASSSPGDSSSRSHQARNRRRTYRLSGGKLPLFIMLMLLCYLAVSFTTQFSRLNGMNRDVQKIQQQIQELEQKNAALQTELRNAQNDAYIEKTAREKLGLIKRNETRVVPVPAGTELKKLEPPSENNIVGD